MTHYTNLATSRRLQDLLYELLDYREHSSMDLSVKCHAVAIAANIADLRNNGCIIITRQKPDTHSGNRLFTYQLVTSNQQQPLLDCLRLTIEQADADEYVRPVCHFEQLEFSNISQQKLELQGA